jgi:surface antigen
MAGESTYTFGNCTWYVAHTLWWVQGHWGNATDWPASAARAGFQLTSTPTVGAAVAYRAGAHYSPFGHCGIVVAVYSPYSFLISEMNFVGFDQVDQRVSNMVDVEAFILPPGVAAGAGGGVATGGGAGTADEVRVEWAGLQQYFNSGLSAQIATWRQLSDFVNAI